MCALHKAGAKATQPFVLAFSGAQSCSTGRPSEFNKSSHTGHSQHNATIGPCNSPATSGPDPPLKLKSRTRAYSWLSVHENAMQKMLIQGMSQCLTC